MTVRFQDRRAAGRFLGERLTHYEGRPDVVVLALPRGGVPVGYEVAQRLRVPLDVFTVRKIGLPWQRELAMGAIASGGAALLNRSLIERAGVSDEQLEAAIDVERRELLRRETAYRGGRPPLDVSGKIVILVDDGLATGSTMRAALSALHDKRPAALVAAVPVGAPESCAEIAAAADEVVCATEPRWFHSVGQWYRDFSQTSDDDVCELLSRASSGPYPTTPTDAGTRAG